MRMTTIALLALALLAAPAPLPAQPVTPVTRTFAVSLDQVWPVAESVLKSLGWAIAASDRVSGALMTDDRPLGFREFGVYAEGTRHRLLMVLTPAEAGRTSVSVTRELFREERILWMKERKPLATSDQSVELAVLEAVARSLPQAAPPPAPPPAPTPPPAPAPPPAQEARVGGRGEFTLKVTYRVAGTAGGAMLTYRNAKGDTEQVSVSLPWELSFDAKGGNFLYVSAQNEGTSGSVTCEIALDGVSRTTSTSSGAYVIATCSNAAERN